MKFLEIKSTYEAKYALFELTTKKELDFFSNIIGHPYMPRNILNWLISYSTPKVLSYNNGRTVAIMISNSNSYCFHSTSSNTPEFLQWLYKENIIENDATNEISDILEPHRLSPSSASHTTPSAGVALKKAVEDVKASTSCHKDSKPEDDCGFHRGFLVGKKF